MSKVKDKFTLIKKVQILWFFVAMLSAVDYFLKIVTEKNNFEHLVGSILMAILFSLLRLIELKEEEIK